MKKINNRGNNKVAVKARKSWKITKNDTLFVCGVGRDYNEDFETDVIRFLRVVNMGKTIFDNRPEYFDISVDEMHELVHAGYKFEGIALVNTEDDVILWSRYGSFCEDYPVVSESETFTDYEAEEISEDAPIGFIMLMSEDGCIMINGDGKEEKLDLDDAITFIENNQIVNIKICEKGYSAKIPFNYTRFEEAVLSL